MKGLRQLGQRVEERLLWRGFKRKGIETPRQSVHHLTPLRGFQETIPR